MKKVLLTAVALIFCFISWTQGLEPKDEGSSITFKIKNFGLQVDGSFTGLKGKIDFDPNVLSTAIFDVSVTTSTINTGIDMRDNHLRKDEYFNVKNFNTIRFVSTKVKSTDGKLIMTGNLTIKKKTIEIKFPFTAQQVEGAWFFKGTFPLNRRDFDVGSGSFSLSDELNVQLVIRAVGKM